MPNLLLRQGIGYALYLSQMCKTTTVTYAEKPCFFCREGLNIRKGK